MLWIKVHDRESNFQLKFYIYFDSIQQQSINSNDSCTEH